MKKDYDALIIGGGLIGTTTALALSQAFKWDILLIEKQPVFTYDKNKSFLDTRTLALTAPNIEYLKSLGLENFLSEEASLIKQIQVSQKNKFGTCLISAAEFNLNDLGAVIEIQRLQESLIEQINQQSNIQYIHHAEVSGLKKNPCNWEAQLETPEVNTPIEAKYIFLAYGMNSRLRESLNIHCEQKDYHQQALVAVVHCEKSHYQTAYLRFTDKNSLAILPLTQNRIGTVLTSDSQFIEDYKKWDDASYLQFLQEEFSDRLGKFMAIGKRQSYPLWLNLADTIALPNLVLLGNTAHSFHPVGAQGFNLGLIGLQDCIRELKKTGDFTGFSDRQKMRCLKLKNFTEYLNQIFYAKSNTIKCLRQSGLILFQYNDFFKKKLIESCFLGW